MFSRYTRCFILFLSVSVILTALSVQGSDARFRDAVNFEDNTFVGISNVEVFHSYRFVSGSDSDAFDSTRLNYQVTTGLMTNFELGTRVPIVFFDNETEGVGDISVFQRFKFSEESGIVPESSGGLELVLPTGQEDDHPPTGTDDLNARIFGTIGHSIDRNWSWLANGSVTIMGGNEFDDKWEYNGALRYQANQFVKVVGELNGRTGGIRDESEIFVSPGAVFQTDGGFSIMVSSPVGLTSDSSDFEPTVQFSYEF